MENILIYYSTKNRNINHWSENSYYSTKDRNMNHWSQNSYYSTKDRNMNHWSQNSYYSTKDRTRKSSCVNARGIPPARECKMLTPPPIPSRTWPPPPPQLDWLLTWHPTPAGLTFDLTPPIPSGTWPPSPPPQVWTDWKHYLPHPSDAGGKYESLKSKYLFTEAKFNT